MKRTLTIALACAGLTGCNLARNPETMYNLGIERGRAEGDQLRMVGALESGLGSYFSEQAGKAKSDVTASHYQLIDEAYVYGYLDAESAKEFVQLDDAADARIDAALATNIAWLTGVLQGAKSMPRALQTFDATMDRAETRARGIRTKAASQLSQLQALLAASGAGESSDDTDGTEEPEVEE